jgi:hypothetical protein
MSFHPKSITDLRNGLEKRRSSREVQKSTFARFLGLFDFRLLQQYRPEADIVDFGDDHFRMRPATTLEGRANIKVR